MGGVTTAREAIIGGRDYLVEGVWSEDGDICWLLHSRYRDASQARYAAWSGRDERHNLPIGLGEGGSPLVHVKVRIEWMREGRRGGYDYWWLPCSQFAPGAVKFYRCWV